MKAGLGRQIGGRRCNRLNAGLFVVGDNRHPAVRLPLRPRRSLLEQFHFAIDAQHLGHFFRKFRITLLQVVTDLVRLHFLGIEDLVQCALRQVGQARVPFGGTVLASVAGEQPRRPQFMRITQILRLPARKRCQPGFRFQRDRRLPAGTRAIVQCGHRVFGHRPLDAALDRLMVQPERLAHREKRRVFPITQQDARALDPARRFGPRPRYHPQLLQIRFSERQFNRPPPRRHIAKSFVAKPSHRIDRSLKRQLNPTHMTSFSESIV